MALLLLSPNDDSGIWIRTLTALMPELEVRVWPDTGPVADIEVALVWKPPAGELRRFPRLKLIISLGMGVDHLFQDPALPAVPIARIVDPSIITQMAEYVCLTVLYYHRHMDDYERQQQEQRWRRLPLVDTAKRTVGLLGLGAIGSHTARQLTALGFPVLAWSRSPKTLEGVECFHDAESLEPLLSRSTVLVCLLPLTRETEGIIDATTLARLPVGAYVVNCARGTHLVEEDLLAALDRGHIAGATLDVFRREPLPPEHPFWRHPKIRITPHIAGITNPQTTAPQIVENIRRLREDLPPLNPVDRVRGY
ncbi:MAG: glyoxylate/hydroxypyruvate reductase A [Candidatus Competibacteraceae bacterium]